MILNVSIDVSDSEEWGHPQSTKHAYLGLLFQSNVSTILLFSNYRNQLDMHRFSGPGH